ncbi:MAG: hypothetical protein IBX55_01295 [Methyloprofundus sp.]|nr:hypothetical protein [Methyloprofundus sp.]
MSIDQSEDLSLDRKSLPLIVQAVFQACRYFDHIKTWEQYGALNIDYDPLIQGYLEIDHVGYYVLNNEQANKALKSHIDDQYDDLPPELHESFLGGAISSSGELSDVLIKALLEDFHNGGKSARYFKTEDDIEFISHQKLYEKSKIIFDHEEVLDLLYDSLTKEKAESIIKDFIFEEEIARSGGERGTISSYDGKEHYTSFEYISDTDGSKEEMDVFVFIECYSVDDSIDFNRLESIKNAFEEKNAIGDYCSDIASELNDSKNTIEV